MRDVANFSVLYCSPWLALTTLHPILPVVTLTLNFNSHLLFFSKTNNPTRCTTQHILFKTPDANVVDNNWLRVNTAQADSAETKEGDGRIRHPTLRCPAHACMQCQRILLCRARTWYFRCVSANVLFSFPDSLRRSGEKRIQRELERYHRLAPGLLTRLRDSSPACISPLRVFCSPLCPGAGSVLQYMPFL